MTVLESFLSKLPDDLLFTRLELAGSRVESKQKELIKRFPNLSVDKVAGLSILLQHLDLLLFTDEELLELSGLSFQYLPTILFPRLTAEKVISADNPIHDIGTSRIYNYLDIQELSPLTLQVSFAHLNIYNVESFKELILTLYTLGL